MNRYIVYNCSGFRIIISGFTVISNIRSIRGLAASTQPGYQDSYAIMRIYLLVGSKRIAITTQISCRSGIPMPPCPVSDTAPPIPFRSQKMFVAWYG